MAYTSKRESESVGQSCNRLIQQGLPVASKSTKKPGRRSLTRASKIGDVKFRRVLAHFVRDHTATETARQTALSVNSVVAIFSKLRVYFWEVGLFTDYYDGQDPRNFEGGNEHFERELLAFHFGRVREKRGLRSSAGKPDYHFAESHWRFHFHVIREQRLSADVHAMMLSHLLELIRVCGPVGGRPGNREAGLRAILRQTDQRTLWLERNAPAFRSSQDRAMLKDIRAIQPRDDQPKRSESVRVRSSSR